MSDTIRILHVEDDPDFADLTATYFRRENERFVVTSVRDASAAREQLTEGAFDCIVSDHDMPGKNGIEFLRAVREKFPDLPFVLFTGKGSEEVASEAISEGVTDYLQKETGAEQFKLLSNRITSAVENYRRQYVLERQSDLFKRTQNLADVGAWEYDANDGEFYFSDKVYEIYGVDSEYHSQPEKDIQAFYHPEDQDTVREAFTGAVEEGESYDIEVRVTAADGTEKWVRTRGQPEFAAGTCQHVRGTIQDITDRKEREQRLKSEREFIEKSLNALDDIFYFVDTEGNFQRWNQTLVELTDYTDDEIESMNALEFFEGEHRESIESAIHEILQTGSNVTEAEITTKDGQHIPYEFRGVRMTDDAGNPTGIIGIARDITARKRREAELMAERDRLDEFAGIISHDLRNPLTIADGRVELAQAECDSEHLDDVAQAIERSQTLVDDLLTLARSGETIGSLEPVQLEALAEECWQVVPNDKATLTVDIRQTISADRTRLRQLLENLFTNAVEHGGEDVTISVGHLADGFYIEDDGVGIAGDELDGIFEAGYVTEENGTGFGLRIVEQIVDAHGWEIQVTDSADGGVRFEITGVEIIE
jgi:PAS domain S-box-containing protein